ncbi:MAG: hypothetical protein WAO58_11840 [Fimbriimonadaceae bacterium]
MNAKDQALSRRIGEFDIDGGAVDLTFSKRLARENGWSFSFAERVVEEYRRFVFLAMTAGHPVTPSDQVDQAWHLHMTYSDSYWERLCGETLPRPLKHNPTKGGEAENQKFDRWYVRTLDAYELAFGHKPPADIWPPSDIRFGRDLHFVRVNTELNVVVPRRWLKAVASGLALSALAIVAVGCIREDRESFLVGLLVTVGIAVLALMLYWLYKTGRFKNSGCSSSGCSASGGGGCGVSGCGSSGCGGGGCGGGGCGGGGD